MLSLSTKHCLKPADFLPMDCLKDQKKCWQLFIFISYLKFLCILGRRAEGKGEESMFLLLVEMMESKWHNLKGELYGLSPTIKKGLSTMRQSDLISFLHCIISGYAVQEFIRNKTEGLNTQNIKHSYYFTHISTPFWWTYKFYYSVCHSGQHCTEQWQQDHYF